jgi:MoxR-like ATPase
MQKIKAGRPLVKMATACYKANLPFLLSGPHGVGKSELLQQAAKELKIDFVVFDLSIMEPTDLVGLPVTKGGKTVYCAPASLPTSGKGFLVFEELNRAPKFMQAPCLQLLTARRLNDYILRKGWLPVAAVNPSDEGYDVSELDDALLSRFVKVTVVADREEWLAWAESHKLHPNVLDYIRADRTVFKSRESNPRAWTYVSNLLLANAEETTQPTIKAAVIGLVGAERAASFFSYLKDRARPLTAQEVLACYPKHRTRLTAWVASGKLDRVRGTLRAVTAHLNPRDSFDAVDEDREQWENLKLFLMDLPGDLLEDAEEFFRDRRYPFPRLKRAAK